MRTKPPPPTFSSVSESPSTSTLSIGRAGLETGLGDGDDGGDDDDGAGGGAASTRGDEAAAAATGRVRGALVLARAGPPLWQAKNAIKQPAAAGKTSRVGWALMSAREVYQK